MAHIPADKILPQDMVEIWDLGPEEPESPELPQTGFHDAASIEHQQAHERRNKLIREYQARKADWDSWQDDPKPRPLRMHVTDARHAMDTEPERYVLELPEDHKKDPKKPEPPKPAAHDDKHPEPPAKPAAAAKPPEPKK